MLLSTLSRRAHIQPVRLAQMAATLSNGSINGATNGALAGVPLQDLPKSNVFTSNLPPDPQYSTPISSHSAPRNHLGPRTVKGALYTYVRPEKTESPELLCVSMQAMRDLGLKEGEEKKEEFRQLVAGNKIFWDEKTQEGIYPWAQCYGGSSTLITTKGLFN